MYDKQTTLIYLAMKCGFSFHPSHTNLAFNQQFCDPICFFAKIRRFSFHLRISVFFSFIFLCICSCSFKLKIINNKQPIEIVYMACHIYKRLSPYVLCIHNMGRILCDTIFDNYEHVSERREHQ